MAYSYEIPSWAGKPPTGLHLDVLKEDKLVQKLIIDEKKCYLFGRNMQMNDFCIDHASCSRVHAALVYHKHLNIAYLVDLGSTHGTFIGTMKLEAHKPTQLHVNSIFHFGASTRRYILRERPTGQRCHIMEDIPLNDSSDGALLGLPETQTELDNLTEYNTAHNRRISMLGIGDDNMRKNKSRKRLNVTFNDDEIIINPEDVDPNVGRFRNLVQSTVVPVKRIRMDCFQMGISSNTNSTIPYSSNTANQIFQQNTQRHIKNIPTDNSSSTNHGPSGLYQDIPITMQEVHGYGNIGSDFLNFTSPLALSSKLGLLLPNPAPDVKLYDNELETKKQVTVGSIVNGHPENSNHADINNGPQKKKYAKEAWPGRKPMLGTL